MQKRINDLLDENSRLARAAVPAATPLGGQALAGVVGGQAFGAGGFGAGEKDQMQRRITELLEENARYLRSGTGGAPGAGISNEEKLRLEQRVREVEAENERLIRASSQPGSPQLPMEVRTALDRQIRSLTDDKAALQRRPARLGRSRRTSASSSRSASTSSSTRHTGSRAGSRSRPRRSRTSPSRRSARAC